MKIIEFFSKLKSLVFRDCYTLLKIFVILRCFNGILLEKCNVKLESRYCARRTKFYLNLSNFFLFSFLQFEVKTPLEQI